jgi:hypothetical protein
MTTDTDTATDNASLIDELFDGADRLCEQFAERLTSTSRLINPLLDLWGLAVEVDPEVARPIEALLTVYNRDRDLATPAELEELAQEVKEAARRAASAAGQN